MAGINNEVSILGEWCPVDPGSQELLSCFLDDFSPLTFADGIPDDVPVGALPEKQQDDIIAIDDEDDILEIEISDIPFPVSNASNAVPESATRGTLAERMAARAGFCPPKLNTELMTSSLADAPSPYVTIPAGLSPATLLDSPVHLSDSLVSSVDPTID